MERPAIAGGVPVRDTKLYYGHQFVDQADVKAVEEVLTSDFLTCGPKVVELEAKLCALTGAAYAVAVSNGTAALHIAAMAAGVGAGDELITTPITFAASANCALYCGGKPVFADINPATYNIDPGSVQSKLTDRTKAVVAVDFTGQAAPLDELLAICREKGVTLIEDGAHSIGTKYKGKTVGSIADITTFSFHPVKTVTGGEGGAVLTNSRDIYEKLLLARSHGITKDEACYVRESQGPWYHEQISLGYNYRLTDIQCALILSQIDKLEQFAARRREIVERYDAAFSQIPQLFVQQEIPESDTVRHLYILRIRPELLTIDRRGFFEAMAAENICCNVHYNPVYWQPYYEKRGYKKGLCPNAE
ncbi:MAG: aminotransferase class I/II-fold pyridoxal phosphate-dependent enzyme, partial [Lachnospiraceae bacterium]|nr:aminotransferase class I/II-fold pyridoxal phosphate-dependent enzyme [Lachnospiraceae bacterium]